MHPGIDVPRSAAARIQQPTTALTTSLRLAEEGSITRPGLFWPSRPGKDIARVGQEGSCSITSDEYKQHKPFYFKLHELSSTGFGYSFADDGYIYQGVWIAGSIRELLPRPARTRMTNDTRWPLATTR
jgi:hypothetical protein